MELIEFIFSKFWIFIGFIIVIGLILRAFVVVVVAILRFFTIKKHGYPPSHCDVDGDLIGKYELIDDDE